MRLPDAERELADVRGAVLASLGGAASARLDEALARHVRHIGQYEASVRPDAAGQLRGGRMMLERAPLSVAVAIGEALGVELSDLARRMAEAAAAASLPLIVGWDFGRSDPCVKLYLNASDASDSARRALREGLGMVSPDASLDAPAVIGLNLGRRAAEVKLYVQHRSAAALAERLGPAARALAATAEAEAASASGVASWDVEGNTARPRAFFVALRDPGPSAPWQVVRELARWDETAVRRALPFAPGPARSVGVSLDGAGAWTVYFKPARGDRPPHTLEPAAIFRTGDTEVGVFLEPRETAARAYARTSRYAISVRPREGRAGREALGRLLGWVQRQVVTAEREARSPEHLLDNPPSPWRRVNDV